MIKKFIFVLPNFGNTITGGTLYDIKLIKNLRKNKINMEKIFLDLSKSNIKIILLYKLKQIPLGSVMCIDGLIAPMLKNTINILCRKHKIIILVHHPTSQENSYNPFFDIKKYLVERKIFNEKLTIVTVSNFIKNQLKKYLSTYKNIFVAEPGIDKIYFNNDGSVDKKDIISIGNIIPRKGYHILIDALASIKKNWKLRIIGDYSLDINYYNYLKNKIVEKKLEEKIIFLGVIQKKEMIKYLKNSKIFVSTTLFEGYGMSHLEAAIMGLKVIVSDLPVLRESLKNQNVEFIEHGNIELFTKAIIENLDNKLNIIQKNFTYLYGWKRTSKKFLKAINAAK